MATETTIHPTAYVEPGATLGERVSIGPFCHVGPGVALGDDVQLVGHVSIVGVTTLGSGSIVHPHAALGGPPQDTKHKGGPTTLTIGSNSIIRESVTMHTGTDYGHGATKVGDNGFFLAYSHVAHDCTVGNNVTLTHGATLGGHSEIGDYVIIGGLPAVHQVVPIGRRAFVGGCSAVVGDVIPYGMAVGNRAKLRGFNVVGLKRSGMTRSELQALRDAYRVLFSRQRTIAENAETVRRDFADNAAVMEIVDFLTSRGKRHFAVPPLHDDDDDDQTRG